MPQPYGHIETLIAVCAQERGVFRYHLQQGRPALRSMKLQRHHLRFQDSARDALLCADYRNLTHAPDFVCFGNVNHRVRRSLQCRHVLAVLTKNEVCMGITEPNDLFLSRAISMTYGIGCV